MFEMSMVLKLRQDVPELVGVSDEVSAIFDSRAHLVRFPMGTRLFGPGDAPQGLFLPVAGTIRVKRRCESGRETTLYRVSAAQSGVLTAACHLSFENRALEAIAETDVEVILLPRSAFDHLMEISSEFRAVVFDVCAKRITDLLVVIEETAARRIDTELAAKLMELSDPADADKTRQRLSVELGAPPEVVSELLGEFERRGWVALDREWIELKNVPAIKELAMTP